MEVRVAHPYSLANGLEHGFAAVGFLPLKLLFGERREHGGLPGALTSATRWSCVATIRASFRRPTRSRWRPCGRSVSIRTRSSTRTRSPIPVAGSTRFASSRSRGYSPSAAHRARGVSTTGRSSARCVSHYGFFRLRTEHSQYLLAYRGEHLAAAVGYTHHALEQNVRVFELICMDDEATPCLLRELDRRCAEELDVATIEVDVSAHAPRMQRTLIEHGYLPTAYIPAFAFHEVERLDVVKMLASARAARGGALVAGAAERGSGPHRPRRLRAAGGAAAARSGHRQQPVCSRV